MSSIIPVTTTQAAEMLEVSDSRVRQLVAQNALKPLFSSGRNALFWPGEIRAYRERTSVTGVARSLPRPEPSLKLDTDAVMYWRPTFFDRDIPFHVRVYRGCHTVVLLSEPHENGLCHAHVETIADLVRARYLETDDPITVTWIEVLPPDHTSERRPQTSESRLMNVIFQRPAIATQTWELAGTAQLTAQEVAHLFGSVDVIDGYDWSTYTPELIEQWQRTGRPVQTYYEPHQIPHLVQIYRDLIAAGASEAARQAVLGLIALWQSTPPREESTRLLHDPNAMTVRLPLTTSAPQRFSIPDDVRTMLPTIGDLAAQPWDDALTNYQRIREEIMTVDRYADLPRPQLEQALSEAADAQRSVMILIDPERTHGHSFKDPLTPRPFALSHGRWDREYVERINEQSPIPARARRILEANRLPTPDPICGLDLAKNPVICDRERHRSDGPRFAVLMWPTAPENTDPLPKGVHIVADEGPTGDRPVYVARHNQIIGLLPNRNPIFSPWNMGYRGSAPSYLSNDIIAFLTAHQHPVTDDTHAAVERLVETARDRLDIDIDILP